MQAWLGAMISVGVVSAVSLSGALSLVLRPEAMRRLTFVLVSFAVGALFGDAFLHLIPEAQEHFEGHQLAVPLLLLGGLLLFFVLEKFLRWRHCHDSECTGHVRPVAFMLLVGDGVHNFIDGMVIGASFLAGPQLGIATSIAVILHEVPQELGDFAVLVQGGMGIRRALRYNFISSLTAFIGAAAALIVGEVSHGFAAALLPVTAGGFIYIAGSDLIPELHHHNRVSHALVQLLAIIAGIGVMILLLTSHHCC